MNREAVLVPVDFSSDGTRNLESAVPRNHAQNPTFLVRTSGVIQSMYIRGMLWIANNQGIGHFIGIALGISATLMFFDMVYPAAKGMFQDSITTMTNMNGSILNGTFGSNASS